MHHGRAPGCNEHRGYDISPQLKFTDAVRVFKTSRAIVLYPQATIPIKCPISGDGMVGLPDVLTLSTHHLTGMLSAVFLIYKWNKWTFYPDSSSDA